MSEANSTNIQNSTETTENISHEIKIGSESLAVIFIFFVLLLGGIVRIFSKKYKVKKFPIINRKNIRSLSPQQCSF